MAIALVTVTTAFVVRELIVFVILALCAYLVDQFVPMPAPLKVVFRAIVALLLVLWLLATFAII